MLHWTSTAASPTEGGLVTLAQVRGARDPYCGSVDRGPETPAALWPAPSALLHPNGVERVTTNKQYATRRMRLDELMRDSLSKMRWGKPVRWGGRASTRRSRRMETSQESGLATKLETHALLVACTRRKIEGKARNSGWREGSAGGSQQGRLTKMWILGLHGPYSHNGECARKAPSRFSFTDLERN
jgi:hypothetical protein